MSYPILSCERSFLTIEKHCQSFPLPSVSLLARNGANPFQLLLATIISLRTRDPLTLSLSKQLLARVQKPIDLINLGDAALENALYPCAFYKRKTQQLLKIAQILQNDFAGDVPQEISALLGLPGVGIKTANLVLTLAFKQDKICVDIHVHRIANRLGWIRTTDPEKTDAALMALFPKKIWSRINEALVIFGIYLCTPQSPKCSVCPVFEVCPRAGVRKSR
jgi:endonuclease-3